MGRSSQRVRYSDVVMAGTSASMTQKNDLFALNSLKLDAFPACLELTDI
jgi:hypothetical protein